MADDERVNGENGKPEWSRPPFEAGNHAAEKSGAWSERRIAERAEEIVDRLFQAAPWLTAVDRELLQSFGGAAARRELLQADIDARGMSRPDGGPREHIYRLEAAERAIVMAADRLGLSPAARVELRALEQMVSVAEIETFMRQLRVEQRLVVRAVAGLSEAQIAELEEGLLAALGRAAAVEAPAGRRELPPA